MPPGPGRETPWGARGSGATAPARGNAAAGGDRSAELRLYGLNAVEAVFARRPGAIRKLYLSVDRIPRLQPLLKWCAVHRVGYRVVEDVEELRRLAASTHHEGVVADVRREPPQAFDAWLAALPDGPCCALWLDGVGNPHNLGAILRACAHFGVAGLLLPSDATLALSGAAARVAEGGAEAVPLVRLPVQHDGLASLHSAGFTLAATLVHGGEDVFATALPARVVYVLGAEADGMDAALARACDLRLSIPGTGAVESLNVAAATAVLLAEWARDRDGHAGTR
jgi:TrmH RNA methyltransferase